MPPLPTYIHKGLGPQERPYIQDCTLSSVQSPHLADNLQAFSNSTTLPKNYLLKRKDHSIISSTYESETFDLFYMKAKELYIFCLTAITFKMSRLTAEPMNVSCYEGIGFTVICYGRINFIILKHLLLQLEFNILEANPEHGDFSKT